MQLKDILTPERCYCDLKGVSKNRLLNTISEKIEGEINHLLASEILESLMSRERLGSTGLGNGIAIPHCRVPDCNEIIVCLVKLDQPIDFDAVDSSPVDLLFVLIVPEQKTEEHVKVLAKLAELFNDDSFCSSARNAKTSTELYNIAITH
jgi:PTS system nitrogen regulatory IIA component